MSNFESCKFAGFQLPRVENFPTVSGLRRPLASRLAEYKRYQRGERKCVGATTYANRVVLPRRPLPGWGDYMDSRGGFMGFHASRIAWCDEIPGEWCPHDFRPRFRNRGWFLDDWCGDTARGFVIKLPRDRGFLAGWSLGEGMCGELDATIWDNAPDAARDADRMAESMAEAERAYRAAEDLENCEAEG